MFTKLPPEMLLHVFSFLKPTDLTRVAQTEKNNAAVASDQSLWRYHCFKDFGLKLLEQEDAKTFYQNLIKEKPALLVEYKNYYKKCFIDNDVKNQLFDKNGIIEQALDKLLSYFIS